MRTTFHDSRHISSSVFNTRLTSLEEDSMHRMLTLITVAHAGFTLRRNRRFFSEGWAFAADVAIAKDELLSSASVVTIHLGGNNFLLLIETLSFMRRKIIYVVVRWICILNEDWQRWAPSSSVRSQNVLFGGATFPDTWLQSLALHPDVCPELGFNIQTKRIFTWREKVCAASEFDVLKLEDRLTHKQKMLRFWIIFSWFLFVLPILVLLMQSLRGTRTQRN